MTSTSGRAPDANPARGRTDTRLTQALQRQVTTLHRMLLRVSGGRLFAKVGASQVGVLTTTGRTSGRARSTPLFVYADGHAWIAVASNGGTAQHPQWFANLRAEPAAKLTVGGHETPVMATVLDRDDRAIWWPKVAAAYRGYESYQTKTDREIPLVRLTPTSR